MSRIYEPTKYIGFEPIYTETPKIFLDTYNRLVALQAIILDGIETERAGIWNIDTGRLSIFQPTCCAARWANSGSWLLMAHEHEIPSTAINRTYAAPLQSQVSCAIDIAHWPACNILHSVSFQLKTGWVVDLAMDPASKYLGLVWIEQDQSGIEWFIWSGDQLRYMNYYGLRVPSPLIGGPYFTPDGSGYVVTVGKSCWWSSDYDIPSKGGIHTAGWLVHTDLSTNVSRKKPIKVFVDKNWMPTDPDDSYTNECLWASHIRLSSITLSPPTGHDIVVSLEDWSGYTVYERKLFSNILPLPRII